ncbi:MFS transporter [Blautia massiliensis]|uniref:MFS transporter n=1 Tax=Blautia massiliensis (ex Durand et al. 2017) TaxID=1737424 RepID=UPI00156F4E9E|nr:glycoside-pentoside-hexuronide (GPH):cation symporter [Blautia massiliensis (ex Durand et al. 2017)]NSK79329.1 MFS transporter [Blautia massiliensis (ex Durand et al. 2017)]
MNLNGYNRLIQKDRVTGFEKFAYGCGEISTNIVFTISTSLLVMFYTDVAHVSAAVIGMIIALSQVFNGVSDIMAGFIVDRTRSRFGRARVWMLRMSVPYAAAAILLMTVPQIGAFAQAIYIFITYNLMLTVVYTMFQLPFATTMTYMTRDQSERAKINIIRMAMSPIGNVLVTLVFTRILKVMPDGGMSSQKNWIILTAIYAVGAAIMMLFCFVCVRERVEVHDDMDGEQIPLKKAIPALFKNKYFIMLFLFFVFFAMYQTFAGTMATYYCKWIVGDTDIIGNVNTACYGITVVATLLLGKVMHLLEKKQWCILGACFIIAGSLILLLNPTSVPLVTFGGLLRGIGMTPILGMIFTMIADAIEYGQWKTGLRTAGAIQSATTSGQKFGQGIGSALIGFIMESTGYNGNLEVQTELATQTIQNLFIYGVSILGVIMIVILLFYKLDKEYPMIMRELLERETAQMQKSEK